MDTTDEFWRGKVVGVVGGTGSWGQECVRQLLEETLAEKILVISRDEQKQSELERRLESSRLRFLLGDIRDRERMVQCLRGVAYVIHLAALKQVGTGQYCPTEFVKTNVIGTMNVAEACLSTGVQSAFFVSSDKAVAASTLYGGTKFVAEQLWYNFNALSPYPHSPHFLVGRFGNALGSRGSVLHIWAEQKKRGEPLRVTWPEMTRFHITLKDAVSGILDTLENQPPNPRELRKGLRAPLGQEEPFIPIMPTYQLGDLAEAFSPGYPVKVVGTRGAGEKFHEQLSTDLPPSNDARWTRLSVEQLRVILQAEGWEVGEMGTNLKTDSPYKVKRVEGGVIWLP